MGIMETPDSIQRSRRRGGARVIAFLVLGLGLLLSARAELQFDVFVGYGLGANEGLVAEGSWFPVFCEIYNDGPAFNGVVELASGQGGQKYRLPVELPTGTRKRLLAPCYSSGQWLSLEAQLRDARGKVRASRSQQRPRLVVDRDSPLIGSLSRTLSGSVVLPDPPKGNNRLQPAVARLSVDLFPDNVIALDGLSYLYLHAARAAELKAPQVTALLAWLHEGGHLILGVESVMDVNAAPWLGRILPCDIATVSTRASHGELQAWLNADVRRPAPNQVVPPARRRPGTPAPAVQPEVASSPNPFVRLEADPKFEETPLPVVGATVRDGKVLLGTAAAPLAVQSARGRGTLTVLLFSPELEPFKSWPNRAWFWARLTDVPIEWLGGWNFTRPSGNHIDGVFGAMTDSRQIRKLPIVWLFVLLLAYLAVIGPVDHYVLKRLNKQMLTWLTFPAYVAFFSVLIYYIGYRLRAGEAEWNEFHVVDVIPHGERADLRGRTYGSVYSPVNAEYPVANDSPCAALRGEVSGYGGQEISKTTVTQQGNSFKALLNAPIWTSQLFLSDWWRQSAPPLRASVKRNGNQVELTVENLTNKKIPQARLVLDGRVYELGELPRTKTQVLSPGSGRMLSEFVRTQQNRFGPAVEARRSQWGRGNEANISDYFAAATAASFLAEERVVEAQPYPNYRSGFLTLPGFDLGADAARGDALLLAWMPDQSLIAPLNKFSPRFSHTYTMLRLAVPMK
jgi:hypothetical protein